jgi:hypothetical protein
MIGRYDGNLQMFVEESRPISLNRLGFLRWLIEHGQLEHSAAGPPSGPLVAPTEPAVAYPDPAYTGRAA